MKSHAARFAVAPCVAAALFLAAPAHASAASSAESFVQEATIKVVGVLGDKTLSQAERNRRVEGIVDGMLDLRRMALFTLGSAASSASPSDIDAFVAAYHDFALAMYESELAGYAGQSVGITGSVERAPGDFIVNATVADPGAKSESGTEVSFRVLDEGGGKYALVDASVEGVWFTLAQRGDFGGFLSQNGGSVGKLTEHLKEMAQRASDPPTPDVGQ